MSASSHATPRAATPAPSRRERVSALRVRRAQAGLLRSLVVALVLALATAVGLAVLVSLATSDEPGPATPTADSTAGVRASSGPVAAPWDTAGTARGRQARRQHVYPRGESALAIRLLATLPDPSTVKPGVSNAGPVDAAQPAAAPATVPATLRPEKTEAGPAIPDTGLARPGAPPADFSQGCWEVQVLVTGDPRRADQVRMEVERRLDVPTRVVRAGTLSRVRCGGCLTADQATRLVQDLRLEGYVEAFRVLGDR